MTLRCCIFNVYPIHAGWDILAISHVYNGWSFVLDQNLPLPDDLLIRFKLDATSKEQITEDQAMDLLKGDSPIRRSIGNQNYAAFGPDRIWMAYSLYDQIERNHWR